MDLLLEKYTDYERLIGCRAVYKLVNGVCIDYTYKKENFVHLIGLHKLNDILLISMFNDKTNLKINTKTVIRNIKNGRINNATVQNSAFYYLIQSRYESFSYDNLTTLNYTDAVIDFNASLINSKLKSDYLLFEERPNGQYNHLAVALDKQTGLRYAETFIHANSDKYVKGQTVAKIEQFRLFDKNNQIIVEDKFYDDHRNIEFRK